MLKDVLFSISSSILLYFCAFQPAVGLASVYNGDGYGEWVTKGGPSVEYETPEGLKVRMAQGSKIVQSYNALPTTTRPVQPKHPPAPARRQQPATRLSQFAQAYRVVKDHGARRNGASQDPGPASPQASYATEEQPPAHSSTQEYTPTPPSASEAQSYDTYPPAYVPAWGPSHQPEYEPYQGPVTFAEHYAPPPEEYPQNVGSPVEGMSLEEFSLAARQYLATRPADENGMYSHEDYDAAYRYALEYAQRKRAGEAQAAQEQAQEQESAAPLRRKPRKKPRVSFGADQVALFNADDPPTAIRRPGSYDPFLNNRAEYADPEMGYWPTHE